MAGSRVLIPRSPRPPEERARAVDRGRNVTRLPVVELPPIPEGLTLATAKLQAPFLNPDTNVDVPLVGVVGVSTGGPILILAVLDHQYSQNPPVNPVDVTVKLFKDGVDIDVADHYVYRLMPASPAIAEAKTVMTHWVDPAPTVGNHTYQLVIFQNGLAIQIIGNARITTLSL